MSPLDGRQGGNQRESGVMHRTCSMSREGRTPEATVTLVNEHYALICNAVWHRPRHCLMVDFGLAVRIKQGLGHDAVAVGHGDGRDDEGQVDEYLPLHLDLAGGDDVLGEFTTDTIGDDRVLDVDEGLQ